MKVLKVIYESLDPVVGTFSSISQWHWLESQDCSFIFNVTTATPLERLYRDGTIIPMGALPFQSNTTIVGYEDGIALGFQNVLYHYDPVTWSQDFSRVINTDILGFSINNGVIIRDRDAVEKLYRPGAGLTYSKIDLATEVTESSPAILTAGVIADQIHWLKDQQIVVHGTTGELVVWDADTETLVLRSSIAISDHMAVDRAHNNILTIRASDKRLVIYDIEPAASAISATTFSPNSSERWNTEAVSVIVTGDAGELIEGQDVEWTLEGLNPDPHGVNSDDVNEFDVNAGVLISTKGIISPQFTKTDASGVARATYCPPGYDWVTGDREIVVAKIIV